MPSRLFNASFEKWRASRSRFSLSEGSSTADGLSAAGDSAAEDGKTEDGATTDAWRNAGLDAARATGDSGDGMLTSDDAGVDAGTGASVSARHGGGHGDGHGESGRTGAKADAGEDDADAACTNACSEWRDVAVSGAWRGGGLSTRPAATGSRCSGDAEEARSAGSANSPSRRTCRGGGEWWCHHPVSDNGSGVGGCDEDGERGGRD